MRESEFLALISLLEDTDPGIEKHVRETLIAMGDEVVPRLEAAWETQTDEHIQQQLIEIVYEIQSVRTLDALHTWRESESQPLLDGWIWITRHQFAALDTDRYRNEINRLVNRIWLELRSGMHLTEKLQVISRMLFVREQFRGNRRTLFDPQNYFLNGIFDSRRGGPISLNLLYLIICEELSLPLQGLILPGTGYMVLVHRDRGQELYVDVFNNGALFFRQDMIRYLQEIKAEELSPEAYPAATRVEIIQALLEHLVRCFDRKKQPEKAQQFERLRRELE
ncbi:MAG: transglutaminase-like domain-containing protein [Bacteroidia bacterium]|nr:transglutaminase-like domain-containing protein [Bacteroidia bacterium]